MSSVLPGCAPGYLLGIEGDVFFANILMLVLLGLSLSSESGSCIEFHLLSDLRGRGAVGVSLSSGACIVFHLNLLNPLRRSLADVAVSPENAGLAGCAGGSEGGVVTPRESVDSFCRGSIVLICSSKTS